MSLSLYLCFFAFALCYWVGRRSLTSGLVAVLAVGYAYGITRANVPETYSHFIFDAAVVGLYAAQLFHKLSPAEAHRVSELRPWLEFLITWPLLLFLVPIQDLLIQFVGLRGNIFLLPFVLFGARLEADDRYRLGLWIAGLNVLAFAFAGGEYVLGLDRFFPHNQVTELIYISKDVVGHTAYRIPAFFPNAHAYGGTMVMSLPLLIGAVTQKHKTSFHFQLLLLGIVVALVGVLMSAARIHFLAAVILMIVAVFSLRSRVGYALGWLLLLSGIGWVVAGEERLQRFMELRDTDYVAERIAASVNLDFFEIAAKYPFGNGLGGGGTSIPYFLRGRIINPVVMENEYARIMLEQGILGLLIWIAFILWLLTRRDKNPSDSWYLGRRLALVSCAVFFISALIGTGLLTSIPQSSLFLLLIGWIGTRQPKTELAESASRYSNIEARAAAQQVG
jgi:hypothetical protein